MRRDIFQAIADPTRRALVMLLAVQAMTPSAMAEHFDVSRQAVSKHLQILTECDLLRPEPQGREIQYHLRADKMREIEKWLEQFKALMTRRFTQLDDVLVRMEAARKGMSLESALKSRLKTDLKASDETSPKTRTKTLPKIQPQIKNKTRNA